MATLTDQTVASTYDLLMKVESSGIDGTLRKIEDGTAAVSAIRLSTGAVQIKQDDDSDATLEVTGTSTLTGDTTVGGTLGVTGITSLTGLINADGGVAVDTNKFTVAGDGTGDTVIAGTLGVTGILTATAAITATGGVDGDLRGAATNVTVADETTDTTCFPLFVTAATGDVAPKSDAVGLLYNSNTGTLTTTAVASALTGDVTGDVTGDIKADDDALIITSGADLANSSIGDGVTAATQTAGDDSTKVATTAYVDAAAGTVLQVVYADLDTATFSSESATMTQITGLTASITPALASNHILIQIMISCGVQYGNYTAFGIYSDLGSGGQIGSSDKGTSNRRNAITGLRAELDSANDSLSQVFMQYRDTPSTWTSGAIAYTATVSNRDNASYDGFYLNRPWDATDVQQQVYGISSITLTEIKG